MSSVIGSLRVNLGLDSAKFESGARRVKSPLAAMKKQFIAVTAVAASVGAAISAMALKGANDIDVAAKSARRLGTSIGGFRALEMAAGEAGVSLSALTNDVQTMDREIARGSKNATSALDRLGLSAKDLEGLEADQKIALIADKVQALGLTSGQASALLQDLGVRNREMVLAVLSGGDAFRQARKDAEDYGLAISKTDSDAIEQANDRIGRLGLIGQYASQQLAIALVPAMGALAQAMTDSLREGGLLRTLIDGLVDNVQTLAGSVAVLVGFLGVKLVAAMAVAAGATGVLSGALILLRKAIFATGFGALIIGAGYLVGKFADLVQAAGGFGVAMGLLGDVAAAVWTGIIGSASAIPPALDGVWQRMKGGFILALAGMADKMFQFLNSIAGAVAEVPGMDALSGSILGAAVAAGEAASDLGSAGRAANAAAADSFSGAASKIKSAFGPAREAISAIKDVMVEAGNATDNTKDEVLDLSNALDEVGGSGGGSSGGGAAGVDKIKTKTEELKDTANEMKDTFKSAFKSLATGAKSFGEVVKDVLNKIADRLLDSAFENLWGGVTSGGSGGGFLGGLIGSIFPSAKGNVFSNGSALKAYAKGGIVDGATTFPMRGNQTGLMGEAGPEAIVPLSRGPGGKLGIQSNGGSSAVEVVGGDLTLSDNGSIMAQFQVMSQQNVSKSVSASQKSFRNSKSGWSP